MPLDAPGKPAKTERISRKLSTAVDAMIDGRAKTVKAAAELAGIARETLSRALAKPHVQAEIERRVRRLMGGPTLARAHGVLDGLLGAESEHVRFKAVELVLACNGIRPPPPGVVVNNSVQQVGWVIDLTDPREDKVGYMVRRFDDNPLLKTFTAGQDAPVIDVTPEGNEP